MKLVFSDRAWTDYLHWQAHDAKRLARVNVLILECRRTPFHGTGKPEPLKGDLAGFWPRRITEEDRLVYRVEGAGQEQRIEFAQCRRHYE